MASSNSVGTLSVAVTGNVSPLEKEFARGQKIISAFDRAASSKGSAFDKLGSGAASFGKLIASSTIGNLLSGNITGGLSSLQEMVTSTIDLAAEFQSANTSFGALLGDMAKGRGTVRDLQKLAIETPFSSRDLLENGKMLLGMGARADQLVPILSRLGDVAMGDAEKLGRLALQFGQVKSKTQFSKQEFNIFAEAGADVEKFADAFGAVGPDKMQTLFKGMEEGKVGFDVLAKGINAMTNQGGRFFQQMAMASKDFKGQFNALLEGVDNLKIGLGMAFIEGFKPGQLFEELSASVGSIDEIQAKIQPLMEKARYFFDLARGAATAFASVMFSDVKPAFQALFDGAPTWDQFKKNAVAATEATIRGLGAMMDGIRGFRYDFADMLEEMGTAAVQMAREFKAAGQLLPGSLGKAFTAAGGVLEANGNGAGLLAKQIRPGLARDYDSGEAMIGKFRTFLKELDAPKPEGQLPGARGEIDAGGGPAKKMGDEAAKFLKAALESSPTKLQEFNRMGRAAQEAARFQPALSDQIFGKLAMEFLNLGKEFENTMKVELPQAMQAGSKEAESVITHAIMGGQHESAQERLEGVMRQARDLNEKQVTELQKVVEQLKRMAFETVAP
ncbi:tape measure protein [Limnoglobus roseus]|uniref:Tape measure protein N-terminal domain-containing protein n=1 Tax=Limnoglobus roseus TaxID=2598579 RepID=A0A5C1A7B0_9BACT|nr:tape measure protein [Limnoglobus roseus]QEL14335.1 hypothetical protein PX52LOC_01223 [Limnoglobus roseus]